MTVVAFSFLFPGLLWGALAAAAPVVIHLTMRTRPRRMVFPALQFVKVTHKANVSKLKLKHLILLAMRMGAILLLVALLARAFIEDWKQVPDRTMPAAAVILVDNSGSMSYRSKGVAILDRGKAMAREVVYSMPTGSRFAVISTSGSVVAGSFLSDPNIVVQQINGVPERYGQETLAPAMSRALSMLSKIDMPRKEIFVVSDMTSRSWEEVSGLRVGKDVALTVLDVGPGRDTNFALGPPRLASTSAAVGVDVPLDVSVSSLNLGGQVNIQLELDGRSMPRQQVDVPVGGAASVQMVAHASRPGVLHGRIVLETKDPLAMDNVRYFTLQASPPGKLLLTKERGQDDLTGRAVAAAVAFGTQSWMTRQTVTMQNLNPDELADASIVLLPNVSFVSQAQWRLLEDFARRGGALWVVAGSRMSIDSYNSDEAQKSMPAELQPVQQLDQAVSLEVGDAGHPLLAPLRANPDFPLSDAKVKLRFGVKSIASDASVVVRFSDGTPAVIERPVGDGRALFWNFNPLPPWSNLAGLTQHALLGQGVVRHYLSSDRNDPLQEYGRTVTLRVPKRLGAVTATVRKPGDSNPQPLNVSEDGRMTVLATELGNWEVQLTGEDQQETLGFSVNAPSPESDLSTIDPNSLASLAGADRLAVVSEAGQITRRQQMVAQDLDLMAPLLIGLLLLMVGEAFFSNRFYKQPSEAPGPAPSR